jgi:putative flippase GtrA
MERAKRILWDKSERTWVQFVRYAFVASIGLSVDFGGLVWLKEVVHLHYVLAMMVNYGLSIWWVFSKSRFSRQQEFLMFAGIGLVGLGLNDAMLWALTSGLGVYYVWSKAITTVGVFFWNFFARKAIFAARPGVRPGL